MPAGSVRVLGRAVRRTGVAPFCCDLRAVRLAATPALVIRGRPGARVPVAPGEAAPLAGWGGAGLAGRAAGVGLAGRGAAGVLVRAAGRGAGRVARRGDAAGLPAVDFRAAARFGAARFVWPAVARRAGFLADLPRRAAAPER